MLSQGMFSWRTSGRRPKFLGDADVEAVGGEAPGIPFIERISRAALIERYFRGDSQIGDADRTSTSETKSEGLTGEEREKKEETRWSDGIIDCIEKMQQYEILKSAGLIEVEINGRECLVKENIDLDSCGGYIPRPLGRKKGMYPTAIHYENERYPERSASGFVHYTDEDGVSNRDGIARGLASLDGKTGKPIELHHLGQKN